MRREMKKMGLPEPQFIEERGSFKVIFKNNSAENSKNIEQVSEQVSEQVENSIELYKNMVIEYCVEPKSAKEIRSFLKLSSRNYVNDNIIKPLLIDKKIDYTNQKSINASNQKYITKKSKK